MKLKEIEIKAAQAVANFYSLSFAPTKNPLSTLDGGFFNAEGLAALVEIKTTNYKLDTFLKNGFIRVDLKKINEGAAWSKEKGAPLVVCLLLRRPGVVLLWTITNKAGEVVLAFETSRESMPFKSVGGEGRRINKLIAKLPLKSCIKINIAKDLQN